MLKRIEKLREAPIEHRRRIAFIISAIITILIFIIWLSVFGLRIKNIANTSVKEDDGSSFKDTKNEFVQEFKNNIADVKDDVAKEFKTEQEEYDSIRKELELIMLQTEQSATSTTTNISSTTSNTTSQPIQ